MISDKGGESVMCEIIQVYHEASRRSLSYLGWDMNCLQCTERFQDTMYWILQYVGSRLWFNRYLSFPFNPSCLSHSLSGRGKASSAQWATLGRSEKTQHHHRSSQTPPHSPEPVHHRRVSVRLEHSQGVLIEHTFRRRAYIRSQLRQNLAGRLADECLNLYTLASMLFAHEEF